MDSQNYRAIQKALTPPPFAGSPAQSEDEAELLRVQKARTLQDCERAKSEIFVSLQSFYGSPHGPLSSAQVKKLEGFFEQIRNDADYFIQRLKKDFPRQRPFLYVSGIEPCVSKEVTGAYPSGHAVLAKLYAMVLGDFYPDLSEKLEKRARVIADDRVLAGMHHPSDVRTGEELAKEIYTLLKKSKRFQTEFKKLAVSN